MPSDTTPAGDDALVEVRDAIRTYFPTEMACAAVACAILPIIHRREAGAKNAGYFEGLFTGNCDGYDEGYAKGRADIFEILRGAAIGQSMDWGPLLDAIERGQREGAKP